MALKIIWSTDAQISRREIFEYWNFRNKSRFYSNKLNMLFKEALSQISIYNEIGKPTDLRNVRLKIVSHFEIIYDLYDDKIVILDIWDTRQNPTNFPVK